MWRLSFGGVINKDHPAATNKLDSTKACPPRSFSGIKAGGGPVVRARALAAGPSWGMLKPH